MENLRKPGGMTLTVCLTCPARVWVENEYLCDASLLNTADIGLDVSRFRPTGCPSSPKPEFPVTAISSILKFRG